MVTIQLQLTELLTYTTGSTLGLKFIWEGDTGENVGGGVWNAVIV